MHRQPDAVSGAVHEVLRQTGVGQHVAGRGVDCSAVTPGRTAATAAAWCLCRTAYCSAISGRGPRCCRCGCSRVVARPTGPRCRRRRCHLSPQFAVRALVVRVGAVGAGADDDERGLQQPSATMASVMSAATSALRYGPARNSERGHAPGRSPPASRSASISAGSLIIHRPP